MERFLLSLDDLTNQSWPDDMDNALAVMSPLPRTRGQDRSSYIDQWESDIVSCFGGYFGDLNGKPPIFRYYQTGAAAGHYTDFLFTLAENFDSVIQTVDGYLGVGAALIALMKRRSKQEQAAQSQQQSFYFYTTVRGIEGMCLYHAVNTYTALDAPIEVGLSTSSRSYQVGSVYHPMPEVQYTVAVSLNGRQYIYVTDSTANVIEHFSFDENGVMGLPLPDWLGVRQHYDPFETVKVDPIVAKFEPFDPGPRFRALGSVD